MEEWCAAEWKGGPGWHSHACRQHTAGAALCACLTSDAVSVQHLYHALVPPDSRVGARLHRQAALLRTCGGQGRAGGGGDGEWGRPVSQLRASAMQQAPMRYTTYILLRQAGSMPSIPQKETASITHTHAPRAAGTRPARERYLRLSRCRGTTVESCSWRSTRRAA